MDEIDVEDDRDFGRISEESAYRYTAQTVTHLQSQHPSTTLQVGSNLDFVPLQPMWPVRVEINGQLIVQFEQDGTWLDAQGRTHSWRGIIEGSPKTIAEMLLRKAGLRDQRRTRVLAAQTRDRLPRRDTPAPTHTWADDHFLAEIPDIPANAPPWVVVPPWPDRIVVTSYAPQSCTFTGFHQRWAVESLLIPTLRQSRHQPRDLQPLHAGDVLATVGPATEDEDAEGEPQVWHPQRVLRVQEAGTQHLRVWLLVDGEVRNRRLALDDFPGPLSGNHFTNGIVEGGAMRLVLDAFDLAVDCPTCGNRGRPIMWGLPAAPPPSYVIVGGCVIDHDPPAYQCACDTTWVITERGTCRTINTE
jgi:hypothetical protein